VEHFQQALELCPWDEDRLKAWCFTNLGAALRPLQRYEEATTQYQIAIEILERLDDPIHRAIAQMNLANIHLLQGREQQKPHLYEDALELYEAARSVFNRSGEPIQLAQVQANIARIYTYQSEWKRARECYSISIEMYEALGLIDCVINVMLSLAGFYLDQNRFHEAKAVLDNAGERLEKITDHPRYNSLAQAIRDALAEVEEYLA